MEKGPWDISLPPPTWKSEKSEILAVFLGNIANGENDPLIAKLHLDREVSVRTTWSWRKP